MEPEIIEEPQYRVVTRMVTTPVFYGGAAHVTTEQVEELIPISPVFQYEDNGRFSDPSSFADEEEEYVPFDETEEPEDMIDDPSMEYDQEYL